MGIVPVPFENEYLDIKKMDQQQLMNEIDKFNGFEEEFKKINEKIDKPFLSDKYVNTEIYEGEMVNNKYDGRGILYDSHYSLYREKKNYIKYNGFFKQGKYEGYGKEYRNSYYDKDLIYMGFFINNKYDGKGILYSEKRKKIYEGYFKNGKYNGIGIVYNKNGKKIKKMIFENGEPLKESYGVLYDENDNEIYKGILKEERPKEGKNITIYDNNLNKIYIGDFYNFKYNGQGILFYKEEEGENNRIHFEGNFKDDLYEKGILYNSEGIIIYEGNFMNDIYEKRKIYNSLGYLEYEGEYYKKKYSGFGKLYEGFSREKLIYEGFFKDGLYEGIGILRKFNIRGGEYEEYLGSFKKGKYHGFGNLYYYIYDIIKMKNYKYLYYAGNFNLGNFEGEGSLYYRVNEGIYYYWDRKMFSGMFKNNEINGEGQKYYKNGNIKFEGIFNTINSCQGIYYSPFGKKLYQGNIKNEKPDEYMFIKLYDDNGNIQYEGEIMNGKYEGEGIEYSNCIKDKVIYYGNFSNDYFINTNKSNKKKEYFSYLVLISDYNSPGKTKLKERIILNKYDDCEKGFFTSFNGPFSYIYLKNNYLINIIEFDSKNRLYIRDKKKIFIYLFNLKGEEYQKGISENCIDELIEQEENPYIYLVGTRLDDFYGDLNNYRRQAEELIYKGKIKKYFEVSSKTGEGIEFLVKNIKIDNAMLLNRTNIDLSLDKIQLFRDHMKATDFGKKIRKYEFMNSKKMNKLKKYFNL